MRAARPAAAAALCAALLVFPGCVTHRIASLDEYRQCPLEKSKFAPSAEQLQRGRTKVVVFPLEENGNPVAQEAGLGLSMAGNIEAFLTEGRTAELVDRTIAERLQEEIRLAEMNQTGSYTGPAVADYAVSGSLTDASFTHKFLEATRTVDKKGNVYVTPPSFRYTAHVSGVLKIYQIPSMKVVKTIPISDNKGRSEETRSARSYAERDDDLVRGAARDAIESVSVELKNHFAPTAYVLDKRVKDSTVLFKVNLGQEDGLQPGERCEIFGMRECLNQLTGEVELERVKVCDAVVSDQINPRSSWVVATADESKEVKLGDEVKVVYSKTAAHYLKQTGTLVNILLAK